ncbi:hypothetical protein WDW86_09840 [Bdellovibrionota bacterium FG-2]
MNLAPLKLSFKPSFKFRYLRYTQSMRALKISLFSLLLLSVQVHATTFLERPFPETVQDAPNVVRGKVGATTTEWVKGEDGTKRIYTYYELFIDESFKGKVERSTTVQMRELGGEKDGVGMHVSGTAQFNKDEDIVAFLGERNVDNSYDLRNMMMGKFNLQKDEEGNEYLVGAGVSSLTRPELRGHEDLLHPGGNAPVTKWTLTSLRNLIKTQAAQVEAGGPSPNPDQTPTVKPSATSELNAGSSADTAASQLQTQVGEGTTSSAKPSERFPIWLGLALLGAAGVVVLVIVKLS